MEHTQTSIIKEFYSATAFLLRYDNSSQMVLIERDILELICKINGYRDRADYLWESIESARCLQTCSDETLSRTLLSFGTEAAMPLKLEALQDKRVERTKPFNFHIFLGELKEKADLGDIDACKLLACLCWLGKGLDQNRTVAFKIWSSLAVNGDREACRALVYAYKQNGIDGESRKWENVLSILQTEYEAFSPVALSSKHRDCTDEELQLANLILYIRQKNAGKGSKTLDRAMIHYVLESKESYEYKLTRLAEDTNFYLIMRMEDRNAGKRFGF